MKAIGLTLRNITQSFRNNNITYSDFLQELGNGQLPYFQKIGKTGRLQSKGLILEKCELTFCLIF
jgi:hypothetical protein